MAENENARLKSYLEREATVLGRAVNIAIDTARAATGKPSLLLPALEWERREVAAKTAAREAKEAAVTPPSPSARDFSDMISVSLEASGLTPKERVQALAMIDNAAVYLHQADPTNRLARAATPGSIGAEWNQLGLTEVQAANIIGQAIDYTHDKAQGLRAEHVTDRLAVEMTRAANPEHQRFIEAIEENYFNVLDMNLPKDATKDLLDRAEIAAGESYSEAQSEIFGADITDAHGAGWAAEMSEQRWRAEEKLNEIATRRNELDRQATQELARGGR